MGSLKGTAWDSRTFFYQLNPCYFLQPEVVGTYLPGTGTLDWRPDVGLELPAPKISLLNFYLSHMDVGPACSTSPPPLTCLDGWVVFNFTVVRLPFSSISDGPK